MSSQFSNDTCVICKAPEKDNDRLRIPNAGLQMITEYSNIFQVGDLQRYLVHTASKAGGNSVIKIHASCQKRIGNEINKKKRQSAEKIAGSSERKIMKRRSDEAEPFNWKLHCLFCGMAIVNDERHPDRSSFSCAETIELKCNLLEICSRPDKTNDDLAYTVKGRLMSIDDLCAAEGRYHRSCFRDFSRQNDLISDEAPKRKGRPKNEAQEESFRKLCQWLELDGELHSVSELYAKLKEIAGDEGHIYADVRYLKQQLVQKYGDTIFFAEIQGKTDVVCFKDIVSTFINQKWCRNKKSDTKNPESEAMLDPKEEANRIVIAAAKIILNELRSSNYDSTVYPSNEDISNVDKNKEWLTPCLRLFMENLVRKPLLQASIGQSIIHAVKPRSAIPPVLFGIGVELDHLYGSRWLLSELSSVGFCELQRSNKWSADNVDITVSDLDGKSSLHAMGIVLSTTGDKGDPASVNLPLIPRQSVMKVSDVTHNKGIPLIPYFPEDASGLSKIAFKPCHTLTLPKNTSHDLGMDLLWHASRLVPKLAENHPGWTGYMTDVSRGKYPGKSLINMLPIIDMDPNDMSCIYSTLIFVINQAKELGIPTPIITFDQPLWLKATEISLAVGMAVVIILGGFHNLMSFSGSIGSVMTGSGLSEALNRVYGTDVVKNITSGKAIARSLRANFMVESILTTRLLNYIFPSAEENKTDDHEEIEFHQDDVRDENLDTDETEDLEGDYMNPDESILDATENVALTLPGVDVLTEKEVKEIELISDTIQEDYNKGLHDMKTSHALKKVEKSLDDVCDHLCNSSRTAKLWIRYLKYVGVIKKFIRAERTGNWALHLKTVSEMINLFAASGHIHYAKCARLYLQQMLELETKYPWVHVSFTQNGYHTVRRSDRFWAGLWSDLIIEQVMMKSLKSRGGLTGGRGTTESVRMTWIHSMHRCAGIHNAMSTLTGIHHRTSEQHIELGENRIKRDISDMKKIDAWFEKHNPFDNKFSSLRGLSSGLCAKDEDNINCDEAEEVGAMIQQKMDGSTYEESHISRADHVRTLELLQAGMLIGNKIVHIDPLLLFTRASTLVERQDNQSQIDCFAYEFTPEPTSLFKDGLMRKPTKAELRNNIISYSLRVEKPKTDFCVIDGGAALHKAQWVMQISFAKWADMFVTNILSKYGCFGEIHIVFDGYDDKFSTKNDEHEGRYSSGKMASNTIISDCGDTPVSSKKEDFLRNKLNKVEIIRFLRKKLSTAGIGSSQSTGDADTLIVATALAAAVAGASTVVVSDDTDVLVLLIHHYLHSMADIFFQTSRKVPVIPKVDATEAQIKKATAKSKQKPIPMWWNMESLNVLEELRKHILLVHAWCGCDSTSAIHGKGKTQIISLMNKDQSFRNLSQVFLLENASQEEIGEAGVKMMLKMYNSKTHDTPASLRLALWSKMISGNQKLDAERLCPTERAIYFHSLRVYLQVRKWTRLDERCLNPCEWGWKRDGAVLKPIKTDLEAAPESILNVVRCNCQITSKNPCGTLVCSCRKHGLFCVKACGNCRGLSCNNISSAYMDDDVIPEYAEFSYRY